MLMFVFGLTLSLVRAAAGTGTGVCGDALFGACVDGEAVVGFETADGLVLLFGDGVIQMLKKNHFHLSFKVVLIFFLIFIFLNSYEFHLSSCYHLSSVFLVFCDCYNS